MRGHRLIRLCSGHVSKTPKAVTSPRTPYPKGLRGCRFSAYSGWLFSLTFCRPFRGSSFVVGVCSHGVKKRGRAEEGTDAPVPFAQWVLRWHFPGGLLRGPWGIRRANEGLHVPAVPTSVWLSAKHRFPALRLPDRSFNRKAAPCHPQRCINLS